MNDAANATTIEFLNEGQTYRAQIEQEHGEEPCLYGLSRRRDFTDGRETWVRLPVHAVEGPLAEAIWEAFEADRAEWEADMGPDYEAIAELQGWCPGDRL